MVAYHNIQDLLKSIIDGISFAEYSITVIMYTLTHPGIVAELIKAAKRKRVVSVIVDKDQSEKVPTMASAVRMLRKAGVEVN